MLKIKFIIYIFYFLLLLEILKVKNLFMNLYSKIHYIYNRLLFRNKVLFLTERIKINTKIKTYCIYR